MASRNQMYARIMDTCTRLYGEDLVFNKLPYLLSDYNRAKERRAQEVVVEDGEEHLDQDEAEEPLPHDPEMIEMWLESKAGVHRLLHRSGKSPMVLTAAHETEILERVAEYMDPNRYLSVDWLRDPDLFPQVY